MYLPTVSDVLFEAVTLRDDNEIYFANVYVLINGEEQEVGGFHCDSDGYVQ